MEHQQLLLGLMNQFPSDASFVYNHFTQVIWKGSTKVGCAYKDCRKSNWGLCCL